MSFNPAPKPTYERKTKKTGIKPTSKYKQRQAKIKKAIKAKGVEYIKCCEGCGRNDQILHPSHRIPQRLDESWNTLELPESIDYLCNDCHELVELFDFDSLLNRLLAAHIEKFIIENAPKYYKRKIAKLELNASV